MTLPLRLALLISGGGTTMEQIILACRDGVLKGLIEPVLVIASKYGIGGIDRARGVDFPAGQIMLCEQRMFRSREDWGDVLLGMLQEYKIDLVGQYGWLCKTPVIVIGQYPNRIINQHPGPLDTGYPDFGGPGMYGRRVHHAVLEYYRVIRAERNFPQFTEATAHWVTEEYDKGSVIGCIPVEIRPDDTVESLQQRVLPEEHRLQIAVLNRIARGVSATVKREERLIDHWRTTLLEQVKAEAIAAYPNG